MATKRMKSEIPVMMSGFSIGMSFRKVMALRLRPRMLCMPTAAMLPSMVEQSAASRPMVMVFSMALTIELPSPPVKSDS